MDHLSDSPSLSRNCLWLEITFLCYKVSCAEIQKDVLLLEEQEGSVNFKVGVMFMKAGQRTDDEMLSNGKAPVKVVFKS